MKAKKVLVLMSGGVDSSVAAALLKDAGHDVAGVYLKFWETPRSVISTKRPEGARGEISHDASIEGVRSLPAQGGSASGGDSARDDRVGTLGEPCWAIEMRDAARVAAKLGIPFDVWDVTEDYKKRVLENFYSEYAAGRTPNPDVLCNSEIKFGVGLDRALKMGYEYIATGHYARVHNPPQPSLILREGGESSRVPPLKVRVGEGELCQLLVGIDKNKDQSYFLWRLMQEQLAHVMFPIGEYTKPQVRALAEKFGLHNAGKKDSQGVCFLGKIDLKEFLSRTTPPLTPPQRGGENEKQFPPLFKGRLGGVRQSGGSIVDVHGTLLGTHDGLAHFTIGQRHGTKLGGTGPYFVVEKDIASNTLIVANEQDEPGYRTIECRMQNAELRMQNEETERRCMARVRYRAQLQSVILRRPKDPAHNGMGFFTPKPRPRRAGARAQNDTLFEVTFDEPARAVAPGQSIVFYDGDKVIGGGVIDRVVLLNEPHGITNSQFPIPNEISKVTI